MQAVSLRLSGLLKITPRLFEDERGFFFESYQKERYAGVGIDLSFVQDNTAFSKKGTLRGLHFQSTPGQAKLVSCLLGEILDVAVDLRPDSLTFGQWESCVLDANRHEQLFIPVGFAHGYLVLSDVAKVHYKVSSFYEASTEESIRWNDPDLAIDWGIENPILSERDQNSLFYKELFPSIRQ
ncbi:MAG: dTDP-4-dehydrorhamnose 3,5-epimerase [Chlamydiia bacterium]|nr:dTDP-4-dehydrorhamnose 3,5-epimerase [Chlamydiia bacterium]